MKCACSKILTLQIEDGEFVSVVGSNGSGKTSMLNIICGSIPVESGKILINGKDITKEKEFKRSRRDWKSVPESGAWNLSVHDDSGKYVAGRSIKESFSGLQRGTNRKQIEHYRELLRQSESWTGTKTGCKSRSAFRGTASGDGASNVYYDAD